MNIRLTRNGTKLFWRNVTNGKEEVEGRSADVYFQLDYISQ
jgi:hypothetical protein